MVATALHYRMIPEDAGRHLLRVSCLVAEPDEQGQRFRLPAWIPGSYLIRDFARHVLSFDARCGDRRIGWRKEDKSSWRCEPSPGPLLVEYEVYANDLSVRGAHFDATHAYFNGACVFLEAVGHADSGCILDLSPPANARFGHWQVATAMRAESVDDRGFGRYHAAAYDELIDHPVEIGDFSRAEFTAGGVPHGVVVSGHHYADMERLAADLAQLCEAHIRMFGSQPPMQRYLFLVTALGSGYGGLEHRDSSSLICRRGELPLAGQTGVSDAYRRFLGLASHEYFHAWNVKRIKPAVFTPYELDAEAHTELLWVFEGVTSYYDDLNLLRSGLISPVSYLEVLAQTITRVLAGSGRLKQSLAEASFDAWTRFYKQDENAPNAIVSYYAKGALVALALDLTLRLETAGRISLDEVMRAAWQRFGQSESGMPEDGFERLAAEVSGLDLAGFFDTYVRGTAELPLPSLLEAFGVGYHLRAPAGPEDQGGKPAPENGGPAVDLGVTIDTSTGNVMLKNVLEDGAACRAGLAAGDELVAIDGLKVTGTGLSEQLKAFDPEERVPVHVFRRDELMRFDVELVPAPLRVCYLTLSDADAEAAQRRSAWLGRE
jgi:predicted metalloprotease with PDZ domain